MPGAIHSYSIKGQYMPRLPYFSALKYKEKEKRKYVETFALRNMELRGRKNSLFVTANMGL